MFISQNEVQLAALSDDELEELLHYYYWLTRVAPDIYLLRFVALVEETLRRGKTGDCGKD